MSLTVGLDFGTHQTKVCVEDSSDPRNKIYRFLTFKDNEGKDTFFLPSVVQINSDDTLSYGFVESARCKIIVPPNLDAPQKEDYVKLVLNEVHKPTEFCEIKPNKPVLPPEPIVRDLPKKRPAGTNKKAWAAAVALNIKKETELIIYKQRKLTFDSDLVDYKIKLAIWNVNRNSNIIDQKRYQEYLVKKAELDAQIVKYQIALREWEEKTKPIECCFKYFKYYSFTEKQNEWRSFIPCDMISVWYLAYVIYSIQDSYSDLFSIQMGIPTTYDGTKRHRNHAYKLLLSAYDLVDNKFSSKEEFLNATYQELMEKTDMNIEVNDDIVISFGLVAIPEAYAALQSVTQQRRLSDGMHLLIDIGGGTTDIAFFTITKDRKPNIHEIYSFSKGLNFLFELISKHHNVGLTYLQKGFMDIDSHTKYTAEINSFKKSLSGNMQYIIKEVQELFRKRESYHNLSVDRLLDAMENRPSVYCGGGGVYASLHTSYGKYFSDCKVLDDNLLSGDSIVGSVESELFPILATAYGLSVQLEEEIYITPLKNVFDHIVGGESNKNCERNDDT